MNANDFVSVDHLLAEITATVNDTDFKKGFSKGWYTSRIQDAIQELSFDTYWLKVQHDYKVPANCQIDMPENVFNIREIYLYSGEICDPVTSQVVYWKRLFNNTNKGNGYTSNDVLGISDEDLPPLMRFLVVPKLVNTWRMVLGRIKN